MKKAFSIILGTSLFLASCTSKTPQQLTEVKVGEVSVSDYFETRIEHVMLAPYVKTKNRAFNIDGEQGIVFLIMEAAFKNIDTESRMIAEGVVLLKNGDKTYTFDKSEMIMLDGWSLKLDQINPLTTFRTRLVYKVPNNFEGKLYYQPGRGAKSIIYLGDASQMFPKMKEHFNM